MQQSEIYGIRIKIVYQEKKLKVCIKSSEIDKGQRRDKRSSHSKYKKSIQHFRKRICLFEKNDNEPRRNKAGNRKQKS